MEMDSKKKKIEEIIGQLLHYDCKITAYTLLKEMDHLEMKDKVSSDNAVYLQYYGHLYYVIAKFCFKLYYNLIKK